MKYLTFFIAATFWVVYQPTASAQWRASTYENEMDGTVTYSASSDLTAATTSMISPYEDTRSILYVGCYDDGRQWADIVFNKTAIVTSDETTEDGHDIIRARMKFDEDEPVTMVLTRRMGSTVLMFDRDQWAIDGFKRASTFLLELNWYGQGMVYFRYSLDGAADAISALPCR